jgi:hypothetical protein
VNCTVSITGHPKNTGGIFELASILKVAPVLEKLILHVSTYYYVFTILLSRFQLYVPLLIWLPFIVLHTDVLTDGCRHVSVLHL